MILDEEFREVLNEFGQGRPALLPMLKLAQERFGCVPRVVIGYISEKLAIPPLEIYGVISFHGMLSTKSHGRHVISVCASLPCHVSCSREIVQAVSSQLGIGHGETTPDGMFSIEEVGCLGMCDRAPALMVNEECHGPLTPAQATALLFEIRRKDALRWNGS